MTAKDQQYGDPSPNPQSAHERVKLVTEVFREYGEAIQAFLELHTRDKADADDLFQELFLSLVRSRLPLKITSMKRYLYRAIANDLASRVRSHQRYRKRLRVYAETRKYEQNQDDPSEETLRTEQTRSVFEMIERHLPRREAEAVTCRFHKNWSNREVADYMGVDHRSVTRYLCAGLKRIKEIGLVGEGNPS